MFVPDLPRFKSAASLATDDTDDNIIVIGSYSKEFGMSGWRVGWLLCPSRSLIHLMKAQDLSIICAPRISQELALLSLRLASRHALSKRAEYELRRELVLDKLQRSGLFEIDTGKGAFFVWFRPLKEVDSEIACLDLIEKNGVCIMPGSLFGQSWRSWFRLSYGSTGSDDLAVGVEKIVNYFRSDAQH